MLLRNNNLKFDKKLKLPMDNWQAHGFMYNKNMAYGTDMSYKKISEYNNSYYIITIFVIINYIYDYCIIC